MKKARCQMKSEPMKFRKVSELHPLPENPRTINKADLDRLVDSIRINGFWEHRPLAIVEREGKFIVLCGNQRLKAAKRCKVAEVPTVLYTDVTPEEEADLILRDNINNGEWDYNALQVETTFADVNFDFIGLSFPSEDEEPKKGKGKKTAKAVEQADESEDDSTDTEDDESDTDDENNDKEAFYRSMYKDVLYESDNEMEIPNLLLEMQAGKVELPLSPWGANSRLRKDVATYHSMWMIIVLRLCSKTL